MDAKPASHIYKIYMNINEKITFNCKIYLIASKDHRISDCTQWLILELIPLVHVKLYCGILNRFN